MLPADEARSVPTGPKRARVLVICTDPIGPNMPGPAIRAWEISSALAHHVDVVLASTVSAAGTHPVAQLELAHGPRLRELVEAADVIFSPPALVFLAEELRLGDKPVAVDVYDPFHLENLEAPGAPRVEHDRSVARLTGVLNVALRRGDFFTCASERQRDFWLGSLAALGRVNPYTYERSPLLDQLVAVVPYGLPEEPPQRTGPGARGVLPGVGLDDKVVLWGGGVYDWLDPVSVVKAVALLVPRWPQLRLVFLGLRHPNPDIPEMGMAAEVQRVAGELGLTDRHVFFNRGWAPYAERANFLLDADVAVSAHLDHVETRYSFRSRVLDYLWAGLPMVLTAGDVLAEELGAAGLAVTARPGDHVALAAGIERMLTSPPAKVQFLAVGARHTWSQSALPLLDFCLSPRRAPDLLAPRLTPDQAAADG